MAVKRFQKQREGVMAEIQDPLVLNLGKERDRCCDELGVDGCSQCAVRVKCLRLWQEICSDIAVIHNLSLTEYRQLSQKFYMLRQERNQILRKRELV